MPLPNRPILGADVYIASTAYVGGRVVMGANCTIMHHVVIRADIAPIRIGSRVNVQDGAVLHTSQGVPLEIANSVGIGHRAVVHCRRIGERTVIGIGAIVLDDCNIGSRCVIAAGSVLAPGTTIPDGKVVMGVPGRIVRDIEDRDLKLIDHVVNSYVALGRLHQAGQFPNIVKR
jgi:carbonic anhydrase/acetyltransferase-like protein (isoleucine patch superfamily)